MDKADRLRKAASSPEVQIKFFWRLYKDWPYALQRLWLYCSENGFQMPDKQMKEFAAWVQNEHDKYAKSHEIDLNKLTRITARIKWLECYYKSEQPSMDVLEKFDAQIKKIVSNNDEQPGNGERKRKHHKLNKQILCMYDQYLDQGLSKTEAREETTKYLEGIKKVELDPQVIGRRIDRYVEKQIKIFQEGGKPDLT